jgi:hypothetical protein
MRLSSRPTGWRVDGALETHMDPGPPFRVQEVEGHAFRARGGEELDRNGGQPERDVEILQRAAWGFLDTRIRLGLDAESSIAPGTSLDLSPPNRFCGVCAVLPLHLLTAPCPAT